MPLESSSKLQLFLQDAPSQTIIDVWQDSKYACVHISATQLAQLFQVLLQACSDIFEHYSRAYSRIFRTFCVLGILKTLQTPITKHIQPLRYIQNTILNIFTKAQSWTFDANLNAPLLYKCYLTSRVTLLIFNVIFQNYSGIFKTWPYLVLLRYVKSPGIFGTFSFSHTQAYSKRYTQFLGTVGHIHVY